KPEHHKNDIFVASLRYLRFVMIITPSFEPESHDAFRISGYITARRCSSTTDPCYRLQTKLVFLWRKITTLCISGCASPTTTTPVKICYTGCFPKTPDFNVARGPCDTGGGPCATGNDCFRTCAKATTPQPAPPVAAPLRCQDANGNLKPNADACDDDPASAAQCPTIFPPTNGAKRPAECDNPLLADPAKKCAKTCKICCELPAYACEDQP
ncbi:hypothetical protein AAVH_40212, partial [Aphelenchoides avenae]